MRAASAGVWSAALAGSMRLWDDNRATLCWPEAVFPQPPARCPTLGRGPVNLSQGTNAAGSIRRSVACRWSLPAIAHTILDADRNPMRPGVRPPVGNRRRSPAREQVRHRSVVDSHEPASR